MARLHLVLIGLPGCGKSVAGRATAERLGASFSDLDSIIEKVKRQPIAQFFSEQGETRFREVERTAMTQIMTQPPGVVSPGGGWAAQPGNLEQVEGKALLIYLRVTPGSAAERIGDVSTRPLLAGPDPVARLTELLEKREAYYRRAKHSVDTDGRSPEAVAEAVVALARKHGGWK